MLQANVSQVVTQVTDDIYSTLLLVRVPQSWYSEQPAAQFKVWSLFGYGMIIHALMPHYSLRTKTVLPGICLLQHYGGKA